MLSIYSKNVSFTQNNVDMYFGALGYGVLTDLTSDALITEELNGSYILEFEYLEAGKLSEYLVEENIIKACGEPFVIYSIKKSTDKRIKILAKHWILNEWDKDFILDSEPTNLNSQSALSWIQARSINTPNISVTGDCTNVQTARYVRKNMLDAVFNEDNSILKRFGGELSYHLNNVTVNKHRGSLTGITIRQDKNITGAEYYLDFSTVATRLVPVGKDGLLLNNVYVDSPLINNYATPIIKKVDVNTDDTTEMVNYCNDLYDNGIDKPMVSIKIDFIELSKTLEYKQYSNLESVHLGDTVNAYIPSLALNISTRVVKTVYNDNLRRITSLELGSIMPNIAVSNVNTEKQIEKQSENDLSILAEAKASATELINHPFGGYIFISENTGELYIMDTNDVSTAQKVWKFGLGGLGFSSTGIGGPYTIALTQDGKIVADFITTGVLRSILLQGNEISGGSININNNFIVDLLGNLTANSGTFAGTVDTAQDLKVGNNAYIGQNQLSSSDVIKFLYLAADAYIKRWLFPGAGSYLQILAGFQLNLNCGSTYFYMFNDNHISCSNLIAPNLCNTIDNDTCTLNSSTDQTVYFNKVFNSIPKVILTPHTTTTGVIAGKVREVTKTYFKAVIGGNVSGNIDFDWIAIG